MNDEPVPAESAAWEEAHPWLSRMESAGEEEQMDDALVYALDELRF